MRARIFNDRREPRVFVTLSRVVVLCMREYSILMNIYDQIQACHSSLRSESLVGTRGFFAALRMTGSSPSCSLIFIIFNNSFIKDTIRDKNSFCQASLSVSSSFAQNMLQYA